MAEVEFKPEPPKEPRPSTARPRNYIDNLVDYEQEIFEMTQARLQPTEPPLDLLHRPVRRVHIWEHNDDEEGAFNANMLQMIAQMNEGEKIRTDRMNPYAELHQELKTSNARLERVKRGCSLFKLLEEEQPTYKIIDPKRRFAAVHEILQKAPAKSMVPPVRKIEFVHPVSARGHARVDLISKINIAEKQKLKLQKISQQSERQHIRCHNELVEYLNHRNQRRMRASEAFYEDMSHHNLRVAQANARRKGQRSRLRVMNKSITWWEDFINYAFSEKVGREEEKFIERIARKPNMTVREYYEFLRELESKPDIFGRCIDMLKWLNTRVHYADEELIAILKYDEERSHRMTVL